MFQQVIREAVKPKIAEVIAIFSGLKPATKYRKTVPQNFNYVRSYFSRHLTFRQYGRYGEP